MRRRFFIRYENSERKISRRTSRLLRRLLVDVINFFFVIQRFVPHSVGKHGWLFQGMIESSRSHLLDARFVTRCKNKNGRDKQEDKNNPHMAKESNSPLFAGFLSQFGFGPGGHLKFFSLHALSVASIMPTIFALNTISEHSL